MNAAHLTHAHGNTAAQVGKADSGYGHFVVAGFETLDAKRAIRNRFHVARDLRSQILDGDFGSLNHGPLRIDHASTHRAGKNLGRTG